MNWSSVAFGVALAVIAAILPASKRAFFYWFLAGVVITVLLSPVWLPPLLGGSPLGGICATCRSR